MMASPPSASIERLLLGLPRRYRVPDMEEVAQRVRSGQETDTATTIAVAIDHARRSSAGEAAPSPTLKQAFVESLARLVREALRADGGDAAFQAMVLRHASPLVREHASLAAHAARDRRRVHAIVNAIAHPGKRQHLPAEACARAMGRLHAYAAAGRWATLARMGRRLRSARKTGENPAIARGLAQLMDSPALARLQRLETLAADEGVQRHEALWSRHGPRSRSEAAAALGAAGRQRGAAMEARAADAVETLARALNTAAGRGTSYRAVTSMHVPASLPGDRSRAKSEWDVALLRRAFGSMDDGDNSSTLAAGTDGVWDVCLLVEAKASIDAATTDFPRLRRGLRLLAGAREDTDYPFDTGQGTVCLRGASLHALDTRDDDLASTILYCVDAPPETRQRLLSAASRMQLLSASASLDYAVALVEGRGDETRGLATLWDELLTRPQWLAVRNQYPALRRVRELTVHVDDLLAAIKTAECPGCDNGCMSAFR